MQTVLLHVMAGSSGPRCELRRHTPQGWQPLAVHELPPVPQPDAQEPPDQVGERLLGLLLHGTTRQAWQELREADGAGVRTLLQVDPPELAALPWELVGLRPELAPDRCRVLVLARDIDRDAGLAHVRLVPPLRLLLVVEDAAAGDGVERAVAGDDRIDAEVLVAPPPGVLAGVRARLRPHVLHAVGIAAARLGSLGPPGPRLVVLDRVPGPAAPSVAALLDARACAVLRVPDTVPSTAAAVFAARFYTALAAERPVDLAAAHAAVALAGTDGGTDSDTNGDTDGDTGPGTAPRPVLTVRVHPEQVLRFAPPLDGGTGIRRPAGLRDRPDDVGPLLDRAESRLARGDDRAPATFEAALAAARRTAGATGRVPAVRMRLATALAWFDRLREADAQIRELETAPPSDADRRREVRLMAAEIALRCGGTSGAEAYLRPGDDDRRAVAVRVRTALAGSHPAAALHVATAAAAAGGPAGIELAGTTAAELMRLDDASWLLDEAADAWLGRDDPEGIVRCHARTATLLMRGYGHLTCAAEHLAGSTEVYVPTGSAAWALRASAQLELLGLQGRTDEAVQQVAAVLDALQGPAAARMPPRRLVRLHVAALAVCAPEQRAGLLERLVAVLGRVAPPAARAVLLAGLCRVRELTGPGAAEPLARLGELLRGADRDPGHGAADRAVLTLTLAELDRLRGRQVEAEAALAFVRDGLPSPITRRAWWSAIDRLGPPLSRTFPHRTELAAVAAATEGLPLLAAAFLVERAEAQQAGDPAGAGRLVREAARRLAQAPEKDTHWHARLRRLEVDLFPSQSAPG